MNNKQKELLLAIIDLSKEDLNYMVNYEQLSPSDIKRVHKALIKVFNPELDDLEREVVLKAMLEYNGKHNFFLNIHRSKFRDRGIMPDDKTLMVINGIILEDKRINKGGSND